MRISRRLIAVVATWVLACGTALAQQKEAEKLAIAAAKSWLALVDAGKYAESWDAASSLFRGAITKEDWVKALDGHRKPLGKLVSRTFGNTKYTRNVPGAPDGEYVAIECTSVFEHKAQASETVTPMLDKDGTWRVSGYFIK